MSFLQYQKTEFFGETKKAGCLLLSIFEGIIDKNLFDSREIVN